MSEREPDLLTLVEVLLLATNEKIKADLWERLSATEKPAKMSTREIVLVRPAEQYQPPAQTRSVRPCPACRKWARRRKAWRTVRRMGVAIALGLGLAAVMVLAVEAIGR